MPLSDPCMLVLMIRKILIVLLIACTAAFVVGCEETPTVRKVSGKDFTLNDLDGNPVRLSDYKGKVVMLEFWASWCAPCRQSVPELKTLNEKYKDRGFSLIAISLDENPKKVREFVEEFDIHYTVVIDNRDVNAAYGVNSIPTTFILDREGNIASKRLGFGRGLYEALAEEIEELL